jgi:hypothetical protein
VNLTTELPPLASNIEIDGPGADQLTVRRADTAENFRIFTVSGDTTVVTISGITISNGNVVDNTEGGGILIADSGTLTVTDSTISDNFTEDGGGGIGIDSDTNGTLTVTGSTITGNTGEFDNGGGIRNDGNGTVTITDSTISDNFSGHEGGALANDGDGTMEVTGSTIGPENFSDSEGGGIYNNRGTLTVTGSTIRGNSTNSDGGGIDNGGTLTVTDSTISGNTSGPSSFGGEGGGIRSSTELPDTDPTNDPDDKTTITNSTISGNTAAGELGIGGGVYNSFGLTVIKNSTITKNFAPEGKGSGVASRGSEEFASAETEVLSSIISENTNTDVDFLTNFGTPTNTFLSRGYNLIGDGNATGAFNQTGDQTGVDDPGLGALADNGGPTQTHALLTGSPAIDAGPPTDGDPIACPPPSTDQRGISRPQGNACDIGSFEVQGVSNQPPDAKDDSATTNEDNSVTINVLANDADPDGDTLTVGSVTQPTNGSAALNADNTVTYTPNRDFNGQDTFTYTISDANGETATATVTVTVNAVNDAPTVKVVAGGACGANYRSGTINLTVDDPDGPEGSLLLSAPSSNATPVPTSNVTFGGAGAARTLTATALSGRTGTSVLTVTVDDGEDEGTVNVRVIVDGNGSKTTNGTGSADMIFGQNGNDVLNGLGSNDLLCGGRGNDTLNGAAGDDTMGGGQGADDFRGGDGADRAIDFTPSQGDTKDTTTEEPSG